MDATILRKEISEFLNFSPPSVSLPFSTEDIAEEQGYSRIRISYPDDEGKDIPAFLLLPKGQGPFPAVLAHHQHHGERHLGKSEICGLVGNPLQAFGPALALNGIAVLAPDSICFEDRRKNMRGTKPDLGDHDVMQHFNELCYRILAGDTLMRKVLDDAARGLSVLQEHPLIDKNRLGTVGHSYGGNTVLFHAALDERLSFSCSSGAACTYAHKMANNTGIEMAEVIPGFINQYDIQDLVKCIAPRALLLISGTQDKYSQDADRIEKDTQDTYASLGATHQLEHNRYEGGHAITPRRFDDIVEWMVKQSRRNSR